MKDEETNVPTESLDARGRIEEALDGLLDRETLDVLLKEVLGVTKQARGWCGTCKRAVPVEIPDAKAVVSAMSDLLIQAKGRPEPASVGERVQVEYKVVLNYPEGSLVEHPGGLVELPDGGYARRVRPDLAAVAG